MFNQKLSTYTKVKAYSFVISSLFVITLSFMQPDIFLAVFPVALTLGSIAGYMEYIYKKKRTDFCQHIKISYLEFYGEEISKLKYFSMRVFLCLISIFEWTLFISASALAFMFILF